jgi:hypothetical protein
MKTKTFREQIAKLEEVIEINLSTGMDEDLGRQLLGVRDKLAGLKGKATITIALRRKLDDLCAEYRDVMIEAGEREDLEQGYVVVAIKACAVCGRAVSLSAFHVHDEVWAESGLRPDEAAHATCLAKRLGRPLRKEDFSNSECNELARAIFGPPATYVEMLKEKFSKAEV